MTRRRNTSADHGSWAPTRERARRPGRHLSAQWKRRVDEGRGNVGGISQVVHGRRQDDRLSGPQSDVPTSRTMSSCPSIIVMTCIESSKCRSTLQSTGEGGTVRIRTTAPRDGAASRSARYGPRRRLTAPVPSPATRSPGFHTGWRISQCHVTGIRHHRGASLRIHTDKDTSIL